MAMRGVRVERIETFGRGGATYAQELRVEENGEDDRRG